MAINIESSDSFVKHQQDIGGVITNLQPVSVAAQLNSPAQKGAVSEAVSSNADIDGIEDSYMVATPKESQKSKKHSSPANLINHNVGRKKKTPEQVSYLLELFQRLNGEWDGKVRKEAMRKTGLSRIQIYKWFFDMKLQQKPKQQKVKPEERVSYPPSIIQPTYVEELSL